MSAPPQGAKRLKAPAFTTVIVELVSDSAGAGR